MDGRRVLLTVPEVAERCGLGQTKIYELLASGEIASVRVGRARRVPVSALDAFVTCMLDRSTSDEQLQSRPT